MSSPRGILVEVEAPERVGDIALRDGRPPGWSAWGPPSGRPVVLLSGAGTSRSLGLARGIAAEAGACIIGVDRPGFGVSDPASNRSLNSVARDVSDLCDVLGVVDPVMIGHSQGAPFALATAARGTVGALALVSPCDEYAHPPVRAALPDELGDFVDLCQDDPPRAREALARFDAESLRAMILTSVAEADRAIYEGPGFAPLWRRATDEAFARGSQSYAADTQLAMARWPIDLSSVPCPVHVWFGSSDTGHSPDLGASLADRLGAERTVVDAGGALLWTHGLEVLGNLGSTGARPRSDLP